MKSVEYTPIFIHKVSHTIKETKFPMKQTSNKMDPKYKFIEAIRK